MFSILTPKKTLSVDAVMSTFTKTLADLREVEAHHANEAKFFTESAQLAVNNANIASSEAERASKLASNFEALLGA